MSCNTKTQMDYCILCHSFFISSPINTVKSSYCISDKSCYLVVLDFYKVLSRITLTVRAVRLSHRIRIILFPPSSETKFVKNLLTLRLQDLSNLKDAL